MLSRGMSERGHKVEVWAPDALLSKKVANPVIKKWLGYIDQFVLFPSKIKARIKQCSPNTLFVFADHALGPWVPLVKNRPHIIHCHDFLAQRSALNEISEHKTRWAGRRYQHFIYKGYSKGRNFISVSEKTKEDLHNFLPSAPQLSAVVYNGFNQTFIPHATEKARGVISRKTGLKLTKGYLLHVGGNQWYKNRMGVLEIYEALRKISHVEIPLLMVGDAPDKLLNFKVKNSLYKKDIHFLTKVQDCYLNFFYSGASAFLFPSLAEGFGWPIAEAIASGCPVITTNEAPMTEVARDIGFLIPRRPIDSESQKRWAYNAAEVVDQVINLSIDEKNRLRNTSLDYAKRFQYKRFLNDVELIYNDVINKQKHFKSKSSCVVF